MGTIPGQLPKVIIFGNPGPFNNMAGGSVTQATVNQPPITQPAAQTDSPPGAYNINPINMPPPNNQSGGGNTITPGSGPVPATGPTTSSTTETTAGTMGGFGGGGGGGGGMAPGEEKSLDGTTPAKSHKMRNMLLIAAGIGILILIASKGKNKKALKSII